MAKQQIVGKAFRIFLDYVFIRQESYTQASLRIVRRFPSLTPQQVRQFRRVACWMENGVEDDM